MAECIQKPETIIHNQALEPKSTQSKISIDHNLTSSKNQLVQEISDYTNQQSGGMKISELENFFNKCLKNEKKCFKILPPTSDFESSQILIKQIDTINPIVYLKQKEKSLNQSQTIQDTLCEYIQNKFIKPYNVVLISCILPSIKLTQSCLISAAFTIIEVSNQVIISQKEMEYNLNQIRQRQRQIYQQADQNQIKEKIQDYIFTKVIYFSNYHIQNYHIRNHRLVDTIIICPYLNATQFTPQISQDTILKFVTDKLESILRNTPQRLEDIVLVLPASVDLKILNQIISYETTIFYHNYEDKRIVQRIVIPSNYKTAQSNRNSQKPKGLQQKKTGLPRVSSRLTIKNLAHVTYNTNSQLPFQQFIKYTEITGLYIEQKLQYIVVRFKQKIGSQESILENCQGQVFNVTKSHKNFRVKRDELKYYFMKHIFFVDTLMNSPKYQQDYYDILLGILNLSSFGSLTQCVHHLMQDEIITINNLMIEENLLQYLSILIGCGVIQNDSDLSEIQSILYKLKDIHPVEILSKARTQTITPLNINPIKQTRTTSKDSDLVEFSYQNSFDSGQQNEFGTYGVGYDYDEEESADFVLLADQNKDTKQKYYQRVTSEYDTERPQQNEQKQSIFRSRNLAQQFTTPGRESKINQ